VVHDVPQPDDSILAPVVRMVATAQHAPGSVRARYVRGGLRTIEYLDADVRLISKGTPGRR
jgi:hypothetical protein